MLISKLLNIRDSKTFQKVNLFFFFQINFFFDVFKLF